MTYASHTRRPNPAALAGALGIPAAVGALLVVGLAVTVITAPTPPRIKGETINPIPIPPPPPSTDPVDQANPNTNPQPRATAPATTQRADILPVDLGRNDPVFTLPGIGDVIGPIGPVDIGVPQPTPSATQFDPVGAAPKNNPGRWVTDRDYRPRWMREGLTGSASFALAIDAGGKVTNCTITRSTGHEPLDAATCQLIRDRARFDAARDGTGKPVSGRYSGTITWRIPE